MSMICKGGCMVITCVSITHLICSFSAAKALMAQRYPSRLYAKLVVLFKGFQNAIPFDFNDIIDEQSIDTPISVIHWIQSLVEHAEMSFGH